MIVPRPENMNKQPVRPGGVLHERTVAPGPDVENLAVQHYEIDKKGLKRVQEYLVDGILDLTRSHYLATFGSWEQTPSGERRLDLETQRKVAAYQSLAYQHGILLLEPDIAFFNNGTTSIRFSKMAYRELLADMW